MLRLCKIISTFYRNNLEKSTVTSSPIDSAPPIARPTIRLRKTLATKQKWGTLAKNSGANKRTKKTWAFDFYHIFDPVLIAGKKSLSDVIFQPQFEFRSFPNLRFLIFTHFSVFVPRHWPKSFFYQLPRSFNFLLPIFERLWRFFIDWPISFLSPSPASILKVFYLRYSYNYAHHLLTRLSDLAS